jgi:hypothetical protein
MTTLDFTGHDHFTLADVERAHQKAVTSGHREHRRRTQAPDHRRWTTRRVRLGDVSLHDIPGPRMTLPELMAELEQRGYKHQPIESILTDEYLTELIVWFDDLRRDMRYTAGQAKRNP